MCWIIEKISGSQQHITHIMSREKVDMEDGDKIWREMGIKYLIQEEVIGGMEQHPLLRDM